jgi:hypothetical protein
MVLPKPPEEKKEEKEKKKIDRPAFPISLPLKKPTIEEKLEPLLMAILEVLETMAPASFITGQVTISEAGEVKEILPTGQVTRAVIIKSEESNSGIIYVGDKGVTSTTGLSLAKGDAVTLGIDNSIKNINVTGDTANDKVTFIAIIPKV